jgi:predicted Zn-ribbon and HTH transcriptional regulator
MDELRAKLYKLFETRASREAIDEVLCEMGTTPEHIKEHWMNIAISWKDEDYLSNIATWNKFMTDLEEHKHHIVAIKCRGCGFGFCKCIGDTYSSCRYPVCYHCDTWNTPLFPNPINHEKVKMYLPISVQILILSGGLQCLKIEKKENVDGLTQIITNISLEKNR